MIRLENKRVWSIIKGKVKLNKSTYKPRRVKVKTPKLESLLPPKPDEKNRISSETLNLMTLSQEEYMKRKLVKKKGRIPYLSNLKGSPKSFEENNIEMRKFCNTATSSSYCQLESESKYHYFGNTPRKHKRKRSLSDRNITLKIRESIKLVDKLVKHSKN